MVSHHFVYQLVLFALIWLVVILHLTRSKSGGISQPVAAKPRRRRSSDPQPFADLTQKPHSALCEQETAETRPPPPRRPDPMPETNRRPRTVDTTMHFCPHVDCDYRGWLGLTHLRAHGHPNGGSWRQFHCTSCQGYFPEHHGTIFYGKQADVARIVPVLGCLAEGLGIRATARVFQAEANTVLHWLVEAAEHLRAFSAYFLCDLHVKQLQLDELYAVLSAVKDGEIAEARVIKRLSRSPHWVWVVIDPVTKLLLTLDAGERSPAMAQCVVHQVARMLAPDCVPLFLADGYKPYFTAILTHVGYWMQPSRRQGTGPMPKPRWMPLPELLYAQIVKTVRRWRLVRLTHRAVVGAKEVVEQVLATYGWQINTAFIERANLSIGQHVAAVGRRVNPLCKGEAGLRDQLALSHVYYNFVFPHASLRQALAEPIATPGSGSGKLWRPCTPTMAACLTDHVWSLREVLRFRVPPWPQPQTV